MPQPLYQFPFALIVHPLVRFHAGYGKTFLRQCELLSQTCPMRYTTLESCLSCAMLCLKRGLPTRFRPAEIGESRWPSAGMPAPVLAHSHCQYNWISYDSGSSSFGKGDCCFPQTATPGRLNSSISPAPASIAPWTTTFFRQRRTAVDALNLYC